MSPLLTAFAFALAAPVPRPPKLPEDPLLTVGTALVYRVANGGDEIRVVAEVADEKDIKRVTLRHGAGASASLAEVLELAAGGITRADRKTPAFQFHGRLAAFPGKEGETWTNTAGAGGRRPGRSRGRSR